MRIPPWHFSTHFKELRDVVIGIQWVNDNLHAVMLLLAFDR